MSWVAKVEKLDMWTTYMHVFANLVTYNCSIENIYLYVVAWFLIQFSFKAFLKYKSISIFINTLEILKHSQESWNARDLKSCWEFSWVADPSI